MPFFENRNGEHLWYEDTGEGTALEIVELWLKSEFEGGRHKIRVDNIE